MNNLLPETGRALSFMLRAYLVIMAALALIVIVVLLLYRGAD